MKLGRAADLAKMNYDKSNDKLSNAKVIADYADKAASGISVI